jgi:translation initiation factor IF-1
MSRKDNPDIIEMEGTVKKLLPGTMFDVELKSGNATTMLLCSLAGKLKQHFIKLTVGDRVLLEISKYDMTRGRITYRLKHKTSYNSSSQTMPFRGGGVGKRKR